MIITIRHNTFQAQNRRQIIQLYYRVILIINGKKKSLNRVTEL